MATKYMDQVKAEATKIETAKTALEQLKGELEAKQTALEQLKGELEMAQKNVEESSGKCGWTAKLGDAEAAETRAMDPSVSLADAEDARDEVQTYIDDVTPHVNAAVTEVIDAQSKMLEAHTHYMAVDDLLRKISDHYVTIDRAYDAAKDAVEKADSDANDAQDLRDDHTNAQQELTDTVEALLQECNTLEQELTAMGDACKNAFVDCSADFDTAKAGVEEAEQHLATLEGRRQVCVDAVDTIASMNANPVLNPPPIAPPQSGSAIVGGAPTPPNPTPVVTGAGGATPPNPVPRVSGGNNTPVNPTSAVGGGMGSNTPPNPPPPVSVHQSPPSNLPGLIALALLALLVGGLIWYGLSRQSKSSSSTESSEKETKDKDGGSTEIASATSVPPWLASLMTGGDGDDVDDPKEDPPQQNQNTEQQLAAGNDDDDDKSGNTEESSQSSSSQSNNTDQTGAGGDDSSSEQDGGQQSNSLAVPPPPPAPVVTTPDRLELYTSSCTEKGIVALRRGDKNDVLRFDHAACCMHTLPQGERRSRLQTIVYHGERLSRTAVCSATQKSGAVVGGYTIVTPGKVVKSSADGREFPCLPQLGTEDSYVDIEGAPTCEQFATR